jgi:branched-chain amino acid transport system substrate-binding protein
MKKGLSLLMVLSLFGFSLAQDQLVIGAALALTGDFATGDVPVLDGVNYIVDKINKEGGVMGQPIKLIVKDMQSDPAVGGQVAQELLDEGAAVIIGPPITGISVGVIGVAASQGVSVVSGAATSPEYTFVGGAPAYLSAFGDNVQAAAAAEYALEQGHKTAYIMESPDITYTSNIPKWFVETFTQGGGEILGTVTHSLGQSDFSAQVTTIASANPAPDMVFAGMIPPDSNAFVKQLRDAGYQGAIYGPDAFDTIELINLAGELADGTVITTHGFPVEGSSYAEQLVAMEALAGRPIEGPALAAVGADAVRVIVAAAEAAQSFKAQDITAALPNLENVAGITGAITYKGVGGVPNKPVTIIAVEGGKFVFKKEFVPSSIPAFQ